MNDCAQIFEQFLEQDLTKNDFTLSRSYFKKYAVGTKKIIADVILVDLVDDSFAYVSSSKFHMFRGW